MKVKLGRRKFFYIAVVFVKLLDIDIEDKKESKINLRCKGKSGMGTGVDLEPDYVFDVLTLR